MQLKCEDRDHITVMSIKGELLAEETDRLHREVAERLEARVRDFVIDLAETEFVDSKGLESLLWLQDQCAEQLGQVRLAACGADLKKILEITRLTARFECHEDVETAIQSLR